ncbi:MAG: aldehyde dehydrogenase family protein [Nitrospirae bacterium]|nr:aldehyde dehydrogenase family protein [Nitrospirota bacterium]
MGSARPFLIGHQWRRTETAAPVRNPFDGSTVAEVCQAGAAEAEEAVSAAVAAFHVMRRLPAHVRAAALQKIAGTLTARREELARTITAEAGKPISDARRETSRAIQTFTIAAEEAKRLPGEVIPLDLTPGTESYLGIVRRFPVGPVLGITPFNFPLNLVAHKVAPSLACGNPIVLKPAPQTPLTSLLLGEVVLEAGLPPGALSVVPCDNTVAERLVVDPRLKILSFTGSATVGWMLKAKCGKKRVLLELGGNAGVIVEPDADVEQAAQRCVTGGFAYAGQTCISVQRIHVHEAVYDRFVAALLGRVATVKAGDPTEEATVIGPLIDEAAACRVEEWIKEAVAQGAKLLAGGKRRGALVEATVLADVAPAMKVSCREVFGPVVTVSRYKRFEAAIEALNDSDFGLQAGVFTRDVDRIFNAYRDLDVGAVLANDVPTFRADHMPYGGVKDSGLGREGVRYAIEEMTEPKLLVLNLRESGTP